MHEDSRFHPCLALLLGAGAAMAEQATARWAASTLPPKPEWNDRLCWYRGGATCLERWEIAHILR